MNHVKYQEAYQDLLEVLTEMKRSIDRYEQKEDHKPDWVAARREKLAVIYKYSVVAHREASIMVEHAQQAYRDGYARGVANTLKKQDQQESPQQLRVRLGNEGYRRYHNNLQINKWSDLY